MKYKNLFTTILGAIMMILGVICFFSDLLVKDFSYMQFAVAEILGLILFRTWMSKEKTLSWVEKFIK